MKKLLGQEWDMSLSEADTRAKLIDPALHSRGWTEQILTVLQDTTTGLRNLDRKEFLAQTIPVPYPPEQRQIAAELKDKMTYTEKLKIAIEKQMDTIKALPQAILRKAFSGEL